MSSPMPPARSPIAVVGVSALFPGSTDSTGFWSDILAGRDLLTDVPESHWLVEDYYDPDPSAPDKTYARRGGFLSDIDFDALGWGVPPSIIPATDTTQLLGLIVAQRVLEDASKGQPETLDRSRISVILGVTSAQELLSGLISRLQKPVWVKALREAGLPESKVQEVCSLIGENYQPWQESSFPGLLGNVVAGRIANRLDLGGTNCVTDAACASTFSSLSMALNELYLHQSDMVIAGGADTLNDIFMFMCFSKTPALSLSGDCRPFSDAADGTMLGEGLGMVALKRLEDAERDGDRIYAVIKGVGTSSDGRSTSVYAPVSAGQAQAIRRAYEAAGFSPATVELVEAHGTGTKAGDAAEVGGLTTIFGNLEEGQSPWCALGSVKSQVGHCKAAAGAAGLFKVIMALHHKVLPPTIKVDRPNPALELGKSALYLNTTSRPWIRSSHHPRRAGVSSFGFGGSNFHVSVEEYVGPRRGAARLRAMTHELLVVSGSDGAAVAVSAEKLALAATADNADIGWLAKTSQESFESSAGARLAVVVSTAESCAQLADSLRKAAATITTAPERAFSTPDGIHYGVGDDAGGTAFLFPGQGSQYIGMGSGLAMSFDDAREVWDRAADLELDSSLSLHDVVFPPARFDAADTAADEERLQATEWAQPAIVGASLSLLALMRRLGIEADVVAGHSLGELTALHAAGVMSADDAIVTARRRGELMAAAADETAGAMIAVAHSVEEIHEALSEELEGEIVLANHNSPRQVVLSGPVAAIERAEEELRKRKLNPRRLAVATAFHSPLVAAASIPMREHLGAVSLGEPKVPVYSNSTLSPYPAAADGIADRLAAAIAEPVRFVEMIESMASAGVTTFIEVGPGSVLSGLVTDILGDRARAIALDRKGRSSVHALLDGLAKLAAAGIAMDAAALWKEYRDVVDPATLPSPRLSVAINGANYAKPYPPPGGAAALPGPNPEPAIEPLVVQAPREKPEVAVPVAAPQAGSPGSTRELPPVVPRQQLSAPPPSVPSTAWLGAWQEAQRQTSEAHTSFQQAMAESHTAYLQAAEAGLVSLARASGAGGASQRADTVRDHSGSVGPVVASAPSVSRISLERVPAPIAPAAVSVVVESRQQPASSPVAQPTTPVPATSAVVAGGAGESQQHAPDFEALMLEVVAEKTGYPAEMLSLEMNLEADLGIDSIKRVEILAAFEERVPGLPEVDPGPLGALETLGAIVDHMRSLTPEPSVASASPAASPATGAAPVEASRESESCDLDFEALMLAVVAEKTGYPAEMLALEMDLEADLGIDSIKRVEILAAFEERVPGLPAVDPGPLGAVKTLGGIVDHMRSLASQPPQSQEFSGGGSIEGASGTVDSEGSDLDFEALMLAVVAEKTGYPAEMLVLEMDLEADLGIDSIKRVEILAAFEERVPGLPTIDPGPLGAVKTLGGIVDHMRSIATDGAVKEISATAAVASADATSKLSRYVLDVVASRPLGLALPGLFEADRVVVTSDGEGAPIATALVEALAARGITAEVATEVPTGSSAAIFLGGLKELATKADSIAVNREAFRAARTIAATGAAEQGGLFVTVQDTGGSFGVGTPSEEVRAWASGLPGLVKTAALEWPSAGLVAIDVERGGRSATEIAAAIADEICAGGGEIEVGLSASGERRTLVSVESEVARGGDPVIVAGDVVVVSGGARGVTAAAMIAWANECQARFVLLGRTELEEEPSSCAGVLDDAGLKKALLVEAKKNGSMPSPAELGRQVQRIVGNREIRTTITAIKETGGDARYVSADVTDQAAVAAVLAGIREEWGPVRGLVHGAGVLADKQIVDLTDDEFDRVFDTKVEGLRCLLAATDSDPVALVCLFSSITARCGNRGQAAYAMANEVLNKVAEAQAVAKAERGALIKSLGWGPWKGGMVDARLEAHFTSLGVSLIPIEVGARMLADELHGSEPDRVELVLGAQPRVPRVAKALTESGVVGSHGMTMEQLVDRRSHSYLAGHAINGTPVVPVVMALEWIARMAVAFRPDLELASIRELKVLSGIRLDGFDNGGDRFTLRCNQLEDGMLSLEILGRDGKPHYRARAELVARREAANGYVPPSLAALEAWNEDTVIYDGDVLFHRDQFRVIEEIEGISDAGAKATLRGMGVSGWTPEAWQTDIAAFDGGLQLAVLWAQRMLGGATLPTAIAELRTWVGSPPQGPIRCQVMATSTHKSRAVSDIVFLDHAGVRFAELRGVETHLRPDLTTPDVSQG